MGVFWYPGIMVSQVWPDACYHDGDTAASIACVIDTGFFPVIQTVHIPSARERRAVRDLIEAEQIELTYCIARVLSEEKLNLSSLDEGVRRRSCETAIRTIEHARECGASRLSFVSGARPTKDDARNEALGAFRQSLEEIAGQAKGDPAVIPVIEPLDTETDKKGTLGTVKEATELCEKMRKQGLTVAVCADTSHMILNGEDPVADTISCGEALAEFHLCNPVLDKNEPLYGDRHILFGSPGVLAVHDLPGITRSVGDQLQNGTGRLPLFLEVMNRERNDPEAAKWLLDYNIDILRGLVGDQK